MERPRRGLFLIFSFFALFGTVFGIQANKIFAIPESGQDGNCANRDTDTMVTEASLLATNAIHALKDILSGKLERGKNTEYLETAARENWGVTFQKGIFRRPKNLVVSSGEDRLKRALENYQLVFDKLSSNSAGEAKLACGDTFLKWIVTYGDMGASPPEKPLAETWAETHGGKVSDYPGFYWNKAWKILLGDQGVKTKDGKPGGHLCQDTTSMGTTFNQYGLIMICDRAWVKESLMDLVSGTQKIREGESIDLVNSIGGTFLHEMMHWINKGINDEVVDRSGKQAVAYGYDNCAYMAAQSKYQAKTVTNADTYRSFALMVTLKNVDWVKGKASMEPTETTSTKEPQVPKETASTKKPEKPQKPKEHPKPQKPQKPKVPKVIR